MTSEQVEPTPGARVPSQRRRRRTLRRLAGAAAAIVALSGCGSSAPEPGGSPDAAGPSADPVDGGGSARDGLLGDAGAINVDLVTELSDAEVSELADAVNAFGLDLHRHLAAEDPGANVVTSPLSVSTLLAMVAAGADGQAAEEMIDALGLEAARDDRYAALLRQVSDTDQVELAVANALWLDDDHELVGDYAAFVRDTFGATIDTAPLEDQATADTIDAWVRQSTNDRIDGIASDLGLPSGQAVLVLADAVYFLGEWTTQFDPADTRDAAFRLADGTEVQVPTMHSPEGEFPVEVADAGSFRMLRLPYGDDGRYAMDVLLPAADRDLPALMGELDAGLLARAADRLEPLTDLQLALPTFELEWDADLDEVLPELGIRSVFTSGGLPNMSPSSPFLAAVVHKTYIRVDEAGTEAAAVTGGVTAVSAPERFAVDRPFAFTITDTQTGTVLFLGSVTDPRG